MHGRELPAPRLPLITQGHCGPVLYTAPVQSGRQTERRRRRSSWRGREGGRVAVGRQRMVGDQPVCPPQLLLRGWGAVLLSQCLSSVFSQIPDPEVRHCCIPVSSTAPALDGLFWRVLCGSCRCFHHQTNFTKRVFVVLVAGLLANKVRRRLTDTVKTRC